MAVLMTLERPGRAPPPRTTARNEILGIAGERRRSGRGLITHVCGVTDDGIVIVDVGTR